MNKRVVREPGSNLGDLPHWGMWLTEEREVPRFQRVCWNLGGSYYSCNPRASNIFWPLLFMRKSQNSLVCTYPALHREYPLLVTADQPFPVPCYTSTSWEWICAVISIWRESLLFLPQVRLPLRPQVLSQRLSHQVKSSLWRCPCVLVRLSIKF